MNSDRLCREIILLEGLYAINEVGLKEVRGIILALALRLNTGLGSGLFYGRLIVLGELVGGVSQSWLVQRLDLEGNGLLDIGEEKINEYLVGPDLDVSTPKVGKGIADVAVNPDVIPRGINPECVDKKIAALYIEYQQSKNSMEIMMFIQPSKLTKLLKVKLIQLVLAVGDFIDSVPPETFPKKLIGLIKFLKALNIKEYHSHHLTLQRTGSWQYRILVLS